MVAMNANLRIAIYVAVANTRAKTTKTCTMQRLTKKNAILTKTQDWRRKIHGNRRGNMGMYHKNRFVGPKRKRYIKRQTSRGMRRAAKKSCRPEQEESTTLTRKSRNLHGYSSLLFS